jgi:hypothetical protein
MMHVSTRMPSSIRSCREGLCSPSGPDDTCAAPPDPRLRLQALDHASGWSGRSDLSWHPRGRAPGTRQMAPDEPPVYMIPPGDLCVRRVVVRQERPHPPGVVVRPRDGRTGRRPAGDEGAELPTPLVICGVDPTEGRSGAVDEQFAQIDISAWAHAEEPRPAAR